MPIHSMYNYSLAYPKLYSRSLLDGLLTDPSPEYRYMELSEDVARCGRDHNEGVHTRSMPTLWTFRDGLPVERKCLRSMSYLSNEDAIKDASYSERVRYQQVTAPKSYDREEHSSNGEASSEPLLEGDAIHTQKDDVYSEGVKKNWLNDWLVSSLLVGFVKELVFNNEIHKISM